MINGTDKKCCRKQSMCGLEGVREGRWEGGGRGEGRRYVCT